MHTQQRIASWVDQTEEHRSQFGLAITPSSQQGTPPKSPPRLRRERGPRPMHERRRPSFSSSSGSSSTSSTDSSGRSPGLAMRMPAFRPRYLQHLVANQFHSNRHYDSDAHHSNRHHGHSSHGRAPPSSSSYVIAAPPIYHHNNGDGSSGVAGQKMKGMSRAVGHFLLF